MLKRCAHCGRYFRPDSRVGQRQKVCSRQPCKRARKKQAQKKWRSNNPDYFAQHYRDYVKPWRQKHRNPCGHSQFKMIKDEIPTSKPLQKLVLLIPGESKEVIKDEIILRRLDRHTFAAYGP